MYINIISTSPIENYQIRPERLNDDDFSNPFFFTEKSLTRDRKKEPWIKLGLIEDLVIDVTKYR